MWGATPSRIIPPPPSVNFNPRAPCGARLQTDAVRRGFQQISIHAPRVGRDRRQRRIITTSRPFQSTRPVWGATVERFWMGNCCFYFNPRAPCGARPKRLSGFSTNHLLFQSTRPVWGATGTSCTVTGRTAKFQSTRPVWGATMVKDALDEYEDISIHAPRVGRDRESISRLETLSHFNPRAPCGARQKYWMARTKRISISIHAPRVGRDRSRRLKRGSADISIHAPRVGRDDSLRVGLSGSLYFNPRAPCGARLAAFADRAGCRGISIHAPRVGRDGSGFLLSEKAAAISIHAPRVGRDSKFDDFTPSNLHKRYKRVLARPKNTREKGKIKQKLAYIHAFSAFLGCEGSGTFCALVLRTQYR